MVTQGIGHESADQFGIGSISGKKALVISGVLEGLSGMVICANSSNRVTISMDRTSPGVQFEIDDSLVRIAEGE